MSRQQCESIKCQAWSLSRWDNWNHHQRGTQEAHVISMLNTSVQTQVSQHSAPCEEACHLDTQKGQNKGQGDGWQARAGLPWGVHRPVQTLF